MNRIYAAVVVVLVLLSGYIGYRLAPVPDPVIQEKVVTQEQVVEKIVTVTKRPDGTVIETVEERKKESSQQLASSKPSQKKLSKYSVAALTQPDFSNGNVTDIWTLTAGFRIGELPLWMEAGTNSHKDVLVGLRLEF